ncbi:hypothetical protein BST61_g4197 [Cercospora zeina]
MSARLEWRRADGGAAEVAWSITWALAGETPFYQSANVLLEPLDVDAGGGGGGREGRWVLVHPGSDADEVLSADTVGRLAVEFLGDTLLGRAPARHAIKLVGPRGRGNVVRADFLAKRMHDVEHVAATVTLAEPLQLFDPDVRWAEAEGSSTAPPPPLRTLLRTAGGAVRLRQPPPVVAPQHAWWAALDGELENRLSVPLVCPGLRRQTVFLVEGGLGLPFGGACSWQLYETAKALGVDLIVLAAGAHVLNQRAEFAHWYHRFVAIDGADAPADLAAQLVAAVRQHEAETGRKADALLTTYESHHVAVSTAAAQLGLPCEPVAAYDVVTDKFKTSVAEGRVAYTASSADEALHIARTEPVPWPLILKPCRGWASELVFKVDDIEQLARAVPRMKSESHGAAFVMEHYCRGPEVDINFVLYDGEVLFWEIGDETPKSADHGATSFGELDYLFPSQLPEAEQRAVHDAVLRSITRLGFRNGLYHCEARIANSSVEWRDGPSGTPALRPRQPRPDAPAESWLIEINTRPPGGDTCDFIEATWGVDYWALLLLTKLADAAAWAHALSRPYRDGAQYHADKVWIIASWDAPQKGIWASDNITDDLMQRRPDIAKQVSQHRTFAKRGDRMIHPASGANSFVAYLHLFSRESRTHLLELATEVRNELRIDIE